MGSVLPWARSDYRELIGLPLGHAAEASLLLTRLAADRLDDARALARASEAGDPLAYDAAAGIALHAGDPETARRLVDQGLAPVPADPVVEGLLHVKAFAASSVLGDVVGAQAHGAWLLRQATDRSDEAVAAIVWSGRAVLAAASGDLDELRSCRDAYDACEIPDGLVATREGTRSLVALAVSVVDGRPADVTEPWAVSLLGRAAPMVELGRAARSVGKPLVAPGRLHELTARRAAVLDQVATGATNGAIARSLGVAIRTVQSDVAALKALHGVTNKAGLVAVTRTGLQVLPAPGVVPGRLTSRQQVVAELVAVGYTNAGIATRLGISERTVERHISDACARLGVVGRTALAHATTQPSG